MSMDPTQATMDDDAATVTPACKKPRLADAVSLNLEITPPPVPGRQTVPCLLKKQCIFIFIFI